VTHVRDGDTIEVGGMAIRLSGLAAPERDEPGGAAATHAMTKPVDGLTLRCELDGERAHDRCTGICYLDGKDVAAIMVCKGSPATASPRSGRAWSRSSSYGLNTTDLPDR
jgi:micrococcal nuclease